jgi:L-ascorbate metabolism protein UlaG (beta-lactamase superfamily)
MTREFTPVNIRQVRNATLVLEYGGKRFLIDPMLADRGTYPAFQGTPNDHLRNPTVDLPVPALDLLDVDAVIVTHTHLDHWDDAAKRLVPKALPVFTQNERDAADIRASGFADTRILEDATSFDGITLSRTAGQHGTDAAYAIAGARLGSVCGVVFTHPLEKTLYIAGDTVWHPFVAEALQKHEPDVVVLNCGGNRINGLGDIVMNAEDVARVHEAAPQATILASHMEAVNHATLSRQALREFLDARAMSPHVHVPNDGDLLEL